MNRRLIVVGISIACAFGAILFLIHPKPPPEHAYQGKALHQWLKDFDANEGSAQYSGAESAIRQIGTNCLPTLIFYLRRKDSRFYEQSVSLRAKLHLLNDGDEDAAVFWHQRAARACGALGPAAEPALSALAEAMNDPYAAWDVGNGLSRMMPKSVPALTNILAASNVVARCRAADNLMTAFSHPEVEPMARTALLNALRDSDPGVRMQAASALQFWNVRLDVIVPALAHTLSDPVPSVRGNAAT